MHPILWKFQGITLYSYGLLLAIGFLLAITVFMARARARGMPEESMHTLSLLLLLFSIVGARSLFVLTHWKDYAADPLAIVKLWEGGLILYGGYVAAIAAGILYLRAKNLPVWRVADAAAPSIALGVAIGRLGCFMNGCCYGLPTHLPWGVHFPETTMASYTFPGQALHPSQLYLSGASFLLFALVLALDRKPRFDGWLFWMAIALDAFLRFVIDFTRYYDETGVIGTMGPLTFNMNQALSGGLILLSAFMIAVLGRRREVPAAGVGPQSGPAPTT